MEHINIVLIVDDDHIGRETLGVLLGDQGYKLVFATNGREALTKAIELMPDVILLDIMMPEMDGFEVCQRLRKIPSLANVPVIMLTSLGDRNSRLQGIKVGADEFISKPFDTVELQARLQTILKLNRYRRLLAEKAKFEWVIEKNNEAYLLLNNENKIIYANLQARKYLINNDQDDIIGKDFLKLAKTNYQTEPQHIWENWLTQAPNVALYLVCVETVTSSAFWLQVDIMEMPVEIEEKYLIRLHDITDTILVGRQKWTFQGQVRHKLKTPISPITMGLEYIKNNYDNLTDQEKKEFIDIAYSGANRLKDEVEKIFTYLDVSNSAKLGMETCHINDILQLIKIIEKNLRLQTINIDKQYDKKAEEIWLFISPQAVELILAELLLNAKKFHPNNSPVIEIKISNIEAGVCLKISDNGVHLSTEQLEHIWTPYYQSEKNFTGEKQGMGLGLSMVASLIWEIGGQCRAFNHLKQAGLVIEIILPILDFENPEF